MSQSNNKLSNTAASLAKNKLLTDCYQHMQSDDLILPTIPDVSFKIRRAVSDERSNISSIARIVQIDPSITARLVQIANSSIYSGRKKIESCPEALTRLGLKATQDIVTAFAMKSVFNAKSPIIRKKMTELWVHSSYIASISAVFAHKIPGFDPDRAMLAGLIHDIGIVPILTYADDNPDIIAHPRDLVETVRTLRADIGVQIIRRWDFPADFEDVVLNAENWFRNNKTPTNYADIVMIAQLHSFIGKVDIKKIPKIDDLPAYKKLAVHLDASDSIDILDAAKDEIEQIRQLLA
ncbi:MAG: HDOD domain-containing protein [Methylobacter sp.]|jgi:HD-like signal output (HDOD) protein|nr:HDOD domain-containing protein [Methylobacter sp.]